MASIVQKGGSYCVVYRYTQDNQRKQKWETYKSNEEAVKRKQEVEYYQKGGFDPPKHIVNINELLEAFVASYGVLNWSAKTYEGKLSIIRNHIAPHIGRVKLGEVTPQFIDAYYRTLLKSDNALPADFCMQQKSVLRTVCETHKILKQAFRQAVAWGILPSNPAAAIKTPMGIYTQRPAWTIDELETALCLCTDLQLACAIHLAFACSLRIGEIVGLTWDCIHLSSKQDAYLTVEKELARLSDEAIQKVFNCRILTAFPTRTPTTKSRLVLKAPKTPASSRRVWIPSSVALLLQTLYAQQKSEKSAAPKYTDYNLVFCSSTGFPIEVSRLSKRFSSFVQEACLPLVVFHSLRSTSASYKLILSQGDIKAVQGDTGHAHAKVLVDTYARINDTHRQVLASKVENGFYRLGISSAPLL